MGDATLLVIGHRRPDLDSIAAALGYAAYLRDEGQSAEAGRTGPPDEQSEWALRRFGLEPPALHLDVAPTFATIARKTAPAAPQATVGEIFTRIANGERAVPIVGADGRPVALCDARDCLRGLARTGTLSPILDSERVGPATFRASDRVGDRRTAVVRAEADDFLVVADDGRYLGVAARGDILAPPRRRLVLVDHNEMGQAVPGADHAEIVEVLDHHRLGNPQTAFPIPFTIDVVGATATLVEERWRARGRDLPPALAGVLLCAIMSDTLAFRSPTCTDRDRAAAARLGARAGIADVAAFGEEVIVAGAGLGTRHPDEIVGEDFKEFETPAGRLVVSQAEVKALHEADARAPELSEALERLRERRSAALAALLLTDPVRGRSRLLVRGDCRLASRLPYARAGDGPLLDAGEIVSRKKQLVPALLAALE